MEIKSMNIMKSLRLSILLVLGLFVSGCSVVGAVFDIVTLPIVLVGEGAGAIADAVSDDDDDDKDRDDDDEKDD